MNIKNNKIKLPSNFPFGLFIVFLFFETCVFLLTKVASISAEGNGFVYYLNIIVEPWVWLSLLVSIIQLFLWQRLLAKSDLNFAYSLSSLSYPLTMLLSNYIFKEHLSSFVWVGGGLISLGVLLIGINSSD